jgi:RNA polymerase sigma factor for flagellar operon FliA
MNEYLFLCVHFANRFAPYLPAHLSWEDLYQEGVIGLMRARESFCEGKGCSFKTWAGIKVRSAVLDMIRGNQKEKSTGSRRKKKAKVVASGDTSEENRVSRRSSYFIGNNADCFYW